ncbi:Hypothetical protein EUBREC_0008 [Agathobacter rectalis ATCC 33656]|uniref:Uncharacterized protein n=1 Tax=Agathobacter rectalis (strain ATCC 33656 / DSM 3377 / JCM 17463 / KCTC 5835 / VPI 0990) TaxID=515619 RepID=C4Z944_AGARV|nr:Hypothetical protein EUBREC_0008 [Agathobacter rectalis ATCC 33656]
MLYVFPFFSPDSFIFTVFLFFQHNITCNNYSFLITLHISLFHYSCNN